MAHLAANRTGLFSQGKKRPIALHFELRSSTDAQISKTLGGFTQGDQLLLIRLRSAYVTATASAGRQIQTSDAKVLFQPAWTVTMASAALPLDL